MLNPFVSPTAAIVSAGGGCPEVAPWLAVQPKSSEAKSSATPDVLFTILILKGFRSHTELTGRGLVIPSPLLFYTNE
jgi:hypothetical protein